MGRSFGLIALMVVLGVGGYIYTKQMPGAAPGNVKPNTNVDLTGVRMDLLALANAEKAYFAANGKYGTLDELVASSVVQIERERPNFTYSAEIDAAAFKIVATYLGTDAIAPKRITVDETMAINVE